MGRILALLYGFVVYVFFLFVFLYAIGFVGNLYVPTSIDVGPSEGAGRAVLINVLLLGLFAVQHSVMARQWFKRVWTRIVPVPVERSTYVLFASLVLVILFREWRPITAVVWNVESAFWGNVLWVLFWAGWLQVLMTTFLINHFDLFGLRQVWLFWRGEEYSGVGFRTPGYYKWIRHPLYLGFMIAFWATPHMTVGHLLFAAVTTAYMALAVTKFEEPDLVEFHGDDYVQYRRSVRMFVPIRRR